MTEITSYRDLVVWQKAMDFAVACYRATSHFPTAEKYGLTSQIRRSASSIAANIAEGHGRKSTGAFVNRISIAYGSLMEVETHLLLAHRLDFITEDAINPLLTSTNEIGRMLNGLSRSLRARSGN